MVNNRRIASLSILIALSGIGLLLRHNPLIDAQEKYSITSQIIGLPMQARPPEDAVKTARAAFERAIEYERQLETIRATPLALGVNDAGEAVLPANASVKEFATWQGASDVYPDLGVFPQPEDANEPVWTVFIDGEADVLSLVGPWRREKASNALYVISRWNGGVLSIAYNLDTMSATIP